jgi:class 3 adenylate cyclase
MGPLKRAVSRVSLKPEQGGCVLSHEMILDGKNPFWNVIARLFVGFQMRRGFLKAYESIDKYLRQKTSRPVSLPNMVNTKPDKSKLRLLSRRLAKQGNADLVQLLTEHLRTAPDRDLTRMRPYKLAEKWGQERTKTLVTMLHATDAGLLELSWDILCPVCRNPANTQEHLGEVESAVHCAACNVDYSGDLSQNVEAVFRPARDIRAVKVSDFCTAGPQTTPHIVMQWTLEPGSTHTIEVQVDEGHFRISGPRFSGSFPVEVRDDESNETISVEPTQLVHDPTRLYRRIAIALNNTTQHEQTFRLERELWRDDAALGSEVVATSTFQRFFATEALAPGQTVTIQKLYFLFTDLKDSVRAYDRFGDASAYGACRGHFKAVRKIVEEWDGVIVKTIGDAVMAVFTDPVQALLASKDLQSDAAVLRPPPMKEDLCLKLGLHGGACLAVHANGAMDYFGRTVNMAARFQGLSAGGDLIISSDVADQMEVVGILDGISATKTRETTVLKGLEEETSFLRIHFD